uniref:Mitochondrial import receptor subunit TOM70 n=2 Tax=Ditylenchus dipsaci TaxID=166011 RepID=A0A915CXV1_9BILA
MKLFFDYPFLLSFSVLCVQLIDASHDDEKAEFKYSEQANKEEQQSILNEKANYWRLLGEESIVISDYKHCLLTFTKAYNTQPMNSLTLSGRSTCYLKLGQPKSAFVDANEAYMIDPLNEKAQTNKVLAMIALKRPTEAILKELEKTKNEELIKRYGQETQEEVREPNSKEASAHLKTAQQFISNKDYEDSIKHVTKCLAKAVYGSYDYIVALIARATCNHLLNNHEDAYIDLAEAIELETPNVDQKILFLKGAVLLQLNRYEAIPTFEQALSVDPVSEVADQIKKSLAAAKKSFEKKSSSVSLSTNDKIDRFEIEANLKTMKADISFKTANGKTFKADSFEEAFKVLADYHRMIPKVNIIGMVFDQQLFELFSSTDRTLWKGMLRIFEVDFTYLKPDQLFHLFDKIFKPQSLALSENLGMDTEFLNMAISKGLFECSLAIFPKQNSKSEASDIKLEVDVLVSFLHRRKDALLSVDQKFIMGGVDKLVEKIAERFVSDTKRCLFQLQIYGMEQIPDKMELQNAVTMEELALNSQEIATMKTATLKRRPIKY